MDTGNCPSEGAALAANLGRSGSLCAETPALSIHLSSQIREAALLLPLPGGPASTREASVE